MNPLLPVMDRLVYLAGGRAASGTTAEVVSARRSSASCMASTWTSSGCMAGSSWSRPAHGVRARCAGRDASRNRPQPAEVIHEPARDRSVPSLLHMIFEPGFFSSAPVHVALAAGGVVALVSGIVGVVRGDPRPVLRRARPGRHQRHRRLRVLPGRGQPAVGLRRGGRAGRRGDGHDRRPAAPRPGPGHRDRPGAGLGLAALFLYWDTTHSNVSGRHDHDPVRLHVHHQQLPRCRSSRCSAWRPWASWPILYRPLLLSSVAADLAAVRGISVRLVGLLVPDRDRHRRRPVRHDDRHHPVHGAADRARRDRAPADQPPRAGHGLGRAGRPRRHLARESCWPTTASTGRRPGTAGRSASSWSR